MKIEAGKFYRTRDGSEVKITEVRVSEVLGFVDGCRCSWSDLGLFDDDGITHDYDLMSEWKDAPMVQIEQGKSYRTQGGLQMTQIADRSGGALCWKGSDGYFRTDDGRTQAIPAHDIIAEWPSEPEGKTPAELDVKPGDVVRGQATGKEYTFVSFSDDGIKAFTKGGGFLWMKECLFTIVSRASDKDTAEDKITTWGEMTDAEQDAIAGHLARGGEVEYQSKRGAWIQEDRPNWRPDYCFRIHKEPVKGTVTLKGWMNAVDDSYFNTSDGDGDIKDLSITFPTTDGTPITGVYTNAAGDEVTLEELGDA